MPTSGPSTLPHPPVLCQRGLPQRAHQLHLGNKAGLPSTAQSQRSSQACWTSHGQHKYCLRSSRASSTGQREGRTTQARFSNLDNVDSNEREDPFETWQHRNAVRKPPQFNGATASTKAKQSNNLQPNSPSPPLTAEQSAPSAAAESRKVHSITASAPHATSTAHSTAQEPARDPGWSQESSKPAQDDWGDWGWPSTAAGNAGTTSTRPEVSLPMEGQQAPSPEASLGDELPYVMDPTEVESATELPDLTELSSEELDRVLPITPSPEQLKRASGSPYDLYNRIGTAAIVSLLTVKIVLVATLAFLYPFLGPLVQALNRNRALRSQGRHVALWRATVVDCEIVAQQSRLRQGASGWSEPNMLRLLVGDHSGARSQLSIPYEPQHRSIQVGEAAELLVLARRRTFKRFQALKEIYLPESGLWVSNYPHINRNVFLDISLSVEQERQSQVSQFEYTTIQSS